MEELQKKGASNVTKEEGFIEVHNRKGGQRMNRNYVRNQGVYKNNMGRNGGYWKKKNENIGTKGNTTAYNNQGKKTDSKTWNLNKNEFEAMKNTANKYVVLNELKIDGNTEMNH